jgi:hypothetical protein
MCVEQRGGAAPFFLPSFLGARRAPHAVLDSIAAAREPTWSRLIAPLSYDLETT